MIVFRRSNELKMIWSLTSGSDSSDSNDCTDFFPAAAANAAKNRASTDPIEDEPEWMKYRHCDLKKKKNVLIQWLIYRNTNQKQNPFPSIQTSYSDSKPAE